MPNVSFHQYVKKMELTLCQSILIFFWGFSIDDSEYIKFSFSWNVNGAIDHRCIFYITSKMKIFHRITHFYLSILVTQPCSKRLERFKRLLSLTFGETSSQSLRGWSIKAFQKNFLYHWFCKHVKLLWDTIPKICGWSTVLVLASIVSVLIILCCC